MKKIDWTTHAMQFFKYNGSSILTYIGAIGVLATSSMAILVTPKAINILEKKEQEKQEKLSKMEMIQNAGFLYIPTFVIGMSTLACIFGANVLNKHQQASLISAYSLIDSSYKEYKIKLKELYSDEVHHKIIDALAIERANNVYVNAECLGSNCILSSEETSNAKKLFYDEYGNRYFNSTIEQVISAEYHLNRNFILRGEACLNELYEFLGLEHTDYGSTVGWTMDWGICWIDFNHRKIISEDGKEFYTIEIPFGPSMEMEEY